MFFFFLFLKKVKIVQVLNPENWKNGLKKIQLQFSVVVKASG